MEAKLMKAPHSNLCLDSWGNKKKLLKKCFLGAAKECLVLWKLHNLAAAKCDIGAVGSFLSRHESLVMTCELQWVIEEVQWLSEEGEHRRKQHARWNLVQVRWPLIGQSSNKQLLVHVVKRGETLTSISRQYGVSILSITTVNASIVDIDFVLEGERLNIPISAEEMQMDSGLIIVKAPSRCRSSFDFQGAHETLKIFTKLPSNYLQLAKPTGLFLVLVPLIAFCIGCMIEAFRNRVPRKSKHQEVNKSHPPYFGSRSSRWRTVLDDRRLPDSLDAESGEDHGDPSEEEDQSPVRFEDMSHAYSKLEPSYRKFLSECGISKWGYWRGSSPE